MDDLSERISQLEEQIEEFAETIERCRKLILISKAAIAVGAILILASALGAITFDPAVMIGAFAAVFGGAVGFGSNASTARQTAAEMKAAEALRAELIGQIDFQIIGNGGGRWERADDAS
jgi:hypothetical protein